MRNPPSKDSSPHVRTVKKKSSLMLKRTTSDEHSPNVMFVTKKNSSDSVKSKMAELRKRFNMSPER